MTTLRINEWALREIDEIYRYIARDSVQGAENVVAEIYAMIDFLRRYPRAGHGTMRRNTRLFALSRYPYLIYFQYFRRLDQLRVRSVRHAARRRTIELREPAGEFRVRV